MIRRQGDASKHEKVSTRLGKKPRFRDSRVQDMVEIDWEDLQETGFSCGGDSVRCVVRVGPRIGPLREASVRKVVYDALIGVLLGAHKDQAGKDALVRFEVTRADAYSLLEGMGTAGVIKYCAM